MEADAKRAKAIRAAQASRAAWRSEMLPGGSAHERRQVVAVAGHTGDVALAVQGLADPEPSVRAGALVALARLGALTAEQLACGLRDLDPAVRRRACEVHARRRGAPSGQEASASLDVWSLVRVCLDDKVSEVCEAAAYSLGENPGDDTAAAVAALSRVATTHVDALCREAAVAALGAIGDPEGVGAVIAAMSDKPAVRRRAAVALAAFDGPEVEASLRVAAQSRDWQVRQVAEDLLGERGGKAAH